MQVGPPLTRFPRCPGEAGFGDRATCWPLPLLPPAPGPLRPCPRRHSTGEVVRCRFLGLTRGLLNQKLSRWVLVVESEHEPRVILMHAKAWAPMVWESTQVHHLFIKSSFSFVLFCFVQKESDRSNQGVVSPDYTETLVTFHASPIIMFYLPSKRRNREGLSHLTVH